MMLPTLGAERQATYSARSCRSIADDGPRVLYVPMKIRRRRPDGDDHLRRRRRAPNVTLPVTGGHVKLQWKPDFGMRWAALGVDFEMFGKDHQANAPDLFQDHAVSSAKRPPEQYVYELFLDDKGEKISKTKGNGISVEDWLKYAPDRRASALFHVPEAARGEEALFRRHPEGGGRVPHLPGDVSARGARPPDREPGLARSTTAIRRKLDMFRSAFALAAQPRGRGEPGTPKSAALGLHHPLCARCDPRRHASVPRSNSPATRCAYYDGLCAACRRRPIAQPTEQERAALADLVGPASSALMRASRYRAKTSRR